MPVRLSSATPFWKGLIILYMSGNLKDLLPLRILLEHIWAIFTFFYGGGGGLGGVTSSSAGHEYRRIHNDASERDIPIVSITLSYISLYYSQTEFRWDKEQCVTQEIKTFPVSQVPPFFSFNGTVKVGYLLCDKWIWKTGGHNPGQPTSFQAYYITNQTNAASDLDKSSIAPVMIESTYNSGPLGKTSSHMVLNVTSFAISVDEDSFELPTFCLNRPSMAVV